ELRLGKKRRGAAADGNLGVMCPRQYVDHRGYLSTKLREVTRHPTGIGIGEREQIAEPAAVLAEGDVEVEEERISGFLAPRLGKGNRRVERAIGRLVGIS